MVKIQTTSEITVRLVQQQGGDHMVVAAARVSTSGEEALKWATAPADDNYGLIKYLLSMRHGSVFEHGVMTFFVHAPIFVWREWHRHRIAFSYSEESARYKTLEPVFYIPPRNRPMMKTENWKPGRPKFLQCEDQEKFDRFVTRLTSDYQQCYNHYLENLEEGFDPGLARDGLNVGIYSSCWVSCNPRSLMAFLSLRTHDPSSKFVSYPLYEIEEAARACEEMFKQGWPLTHRAFNESGRVGP